MAETIFSKIISKEIKADIVFENDSVIAFKDINPQAPVHILIVPKTEIARASDLTAREHSALLGEMFEAANKLATENNIAQEGFRLVINCGQKGGQEVYHLHMHLLGGRQMRWPPG
jgi:histidine triad (HIT) family protein